MVDSTCTWTAAKAYGFCLLSSVAYVLFLYILVPPNIRSLPRENPTHIRYRLQAVTVAKALLFVGAFVYIPTEACLGLQFTEAFGLSMTLPSLLWSLLTTAVLMAVFYLGELVGNVLVFFHRRHNRRDTRTFVWTPAPSAVAWSAVFGSELNLILDEVKRNPVMSFRNVIFAPISEELVFRGIIVPVLYMAYSQSTSRTPSDAAMLTAWASVGWFGIAHLHHMIEKIRNGESFGNALKVSLVQLIYTSIFGFIAALLFIRTGTIYSSILSHMICNFVGLPDMGFMQPPPNHHQRMGCNYQYRYILLALHVLGLILFSFVLFPWTASLAEQSYFTRISHVQ